MIYFDNASTTKISELALKTYNDISNNCFFNPSSLHKGGVCAKKKLQQSREKLLGCINGDMLDTLIFCSGATEANNMALFGLSKKNYNILVSAGEHPSIYNTAIALRERGCCVDFVSLNSVGKVDVDDYVKKVSTKKYDLISIIYVNNETGAINDIKLLSEIAKQYNPQCVFHSDCVQAFGKIDVLVDYLGADSISLSGHKINGPRGVGALYIKKNIRFNPIVFGGGQESNLRSGTENLPAICSFADIAEHKSKNLDKNYEYVFKIKNKVIEIFNQRNFTHSINGESELCSPYILSVSLTGIKAEVLVHKLEMDDIYIGTGSACSSKSADNRILSAMGKNKNEIYGNIRLSFSTDNTIDEAVIVANKIVDYATELRNF